MEPEVEIVEPWHEVPLEGINKRTQLGQAVTLGLRLGWEVKLAKTIVVVKDRVMKNGNIKKGGLKEILWVGGAKPHFTRPEKGFLINEFYTKVRTQHGEKEVSFAELKKFILEN